MRTVAREAEALRRQSALLHRGLRPRGVALSARGGEEHVVFLIHGFMATAGVWEPLERRLRDAKIEHVASFTYHPFRSVASLASELSRACAAIPSRARLHLVGHSLGGVIARYYVQELGGARRVAQTISLASPFHGTEVARGVPAVVSKVAPLAREMAPDSRLLARLRQRASADVPHTSVVAAADLVVTPPESAIFPSGETVVLDDVGHNGLLFDDRAAAVVCRQILKSIPTRG